MFRVEMQVAPALPVSRSSSFSRFSERSNAVTEPVLFKMAARWDVLLPGAAHASTQYDPGGGASE